MRTRCGWRRIDSIEYGDAVLSFERGRSRLVERKVIKKLKHLPAIIWNVSVSGQDTIETTASHSFLTTCGWRQTKRLKPGDMLVTADGSAAEIRSVTRTQQQEAVYNLITENEHNFVVGGVVVHNLTWFAQLRMWWHSKGVGEDRLFGMESEPPCFKSVYPRRFMTNRVGAAW